MTGKIKALALTAAGLATSAFLIIDQALAYTFTSTGITIETTDVTATTTAAMNGVATQFEVLKFLGLFLILSAASWVLTKVLGIKIGG